MIRDEFTVIASSQAAFLNASYSFVANLQPQITKLCTDFMTDDVEKLPTDIKWVE